MKPATSNTKLISRELLCEADKSERKFLRFFSTPPHSTTPRKQRWTLFLRLHYPCRWHITSFSLLAQVQSSRSLIKPKLHDYILFFPRQLKGGLRSRGKFERSRAKLVLSRNNRTRFIHRWECAIGKFSQASVPRAEREFSEKYFGGTG